MLKTVVVDNNINSRELISSYLKDFEEVDSVYSFESFSDFQADINDIDLIIFDVSSDNFSEVIKKVRIIKEKNKLIHFIAVSYEVNSELVSKVLKEDIKDFLLKPLLADILRASIKKISNLSGFCANTICVYSPKAACGKTSLAINLSYQLSRETKQKVCLVDLSFQSGDIEAFLGIQSSYSLGNMINSLEHKSEKEVLSMMHKYQDSLYILSFNDFEPGFRAKEQEITKLINSLKNIFQYIVIDTNSLLDESTISILNNSDLVLLLSMLNLPSIRNTQNCYLMFDKLNYNKTKVKLIINRYIENSEISLQDALKTIGKDVFATIPNNYLTLIDSFNLGKSVLETNPQSNIARAYRNLCNKILDIDFLNLKSSANPAYNHGIFNLLRRMGD